MYLFQYNTMKLTTTPEEVASNTRKAWDILFDAFGFDTFHPIEGRGVLMHVLHLGRGIVQYTMQSLADRGYAIAP